ncbi:unnamed protein product [Closterium sp. Naga37s-1]|nr:unnamed protein product [Closterium sp. Naga37s-1]
MTHPLLPYSLSPFFLPSQLDFKAALTIWHVDKMDFMLDFKAAFTIWRVDKLDFMVMLGCFLRIIFGSPEIGLLVASVLSVLKLLLRIIRPHIRLFGLLPGGAATAVSVLQFPNSTLCEGIVMLRIESPLYFPAANFCRQRIKKLCDAYARGYQQPVRHFILDLSVMHDIDVSGIDGLKELHRDLASRDVLRKLWDAKFLAEMGEQWLFVTHRNPFPPLLIHFNPTPTPSLRPSSSSAYPLCLSSASRDVLRKLWDANFLAEMGKQWLFVNPLKPLPPLSTPLQLCLSGASRDVLRKLWDANFLAEMGERWLFVTPADAVKLCRSVAVAAPAVKEQDELLASVQVYDI